MRLTLPNIEFNSILTHVPISDDLQKCYTLIRTRLTRDFSDRPTILQRKIEILDELTAFPLGRFFIQYQGLNGYWTKFLIDNKTKPITPLEDFLLNTSPICLATRERYTIVRSWLQNTLKNGLSILSLPCGAMSEVLSLDFEKINKSRLIGIDLDYESLKLAYEEAEQAYLCEQIELIQADALTFDWQDCADIILSHGLNFYLNTEECETLYSNLFRALKPGGVLVGSFLTKSPDIDPKSPWNMEEIDMKDLHYQSEILSVISPRWRLCQTYDEIADLLTDIGFFNIEIVEDSRRMMPVFFAKKRHLS